MPARTASYYEPIAYLNSPMVLQGLLNLALPPLPPQSSHTGKVEAGISESSATGSLTNHYVKTLKVPTYGGDQTKFEEFWGLFEGLVDQSKEPLNLKMARLRQCLFGSTLESIQGLGVSKPEYEEAKEILTTN